MAPESEAAAEVEQLLRMCDQVAEIMNFATYRFVQEPRATTLLVVSAN